MRRVLEKALSSQRRGYAVATQMSEDKQISSIRRRLPMIKEHDGQ